VKPDGAEMTDQEWNEASARCLGVFYTGSALAEYTERGQPVTDGNFVLLLNAAHEDIPFALPAIAAGRDWRVVVDTSWHNYSQRVVQPSGSAYPLKARSLALLIEHDIAERRAES